MRKSKYNKDVLFLWEGSIKPENINLEVVPSTFQISDKLQQKVDEEWNKILETNPNFFDGPKWRTEFIRENHKSIPKKLDIFVSPSIKYSHHKIIRTIEDQTMQFYPNPLGVNTIQITADNYILIGIRGKGSDHSGLGLIGSGFVDRYLDKEGKSKKPEMIGYTIQRECLEETVYKKEPAFSMDNALAVNAIFSSIHATGIGFYLPIFLTSKEVDIRGNEYSDLLFLPNKSKNIYPILENGSYKGISASGQLLGCLERCFNILKNQNA